MQIQNLCFTCILVFKEWDTFVLKRLKYPVHQRHLICSGRFNNKLSSSSIFINNFRTNCSSFGILPVYNHTLPICFPKIVILHKFGNLLNPIYKTHNCQKKNIFLIFKIFALMISTHFLKNSHASIFNKLIYGTVRYQITSIVKSLM